MNREAIIRIAQQAEVPIRGHYDEQGLTPQELQRFAALVAAAERNRTWTQDLERFAALVAAAEREACAEVCEGHYDTAQAARAIRARGEK